MRNSFAAGMFVLRTKQPWNSITQCTITYYVHVGVAGKHLSTKNEKVEVQRANEKTYSMY